MGLRQHQQMTDCFGHWGQTTKFHLLTTRWCTCTKALLHRTNCVVHRSQKHADPVTSSVLDYWRHKPSEVCYLKMFTHHHFDCWSFHAAPIHEAPMFTSSYVGPPLCAQDKVWICMATSYNEDVSSKYLHYQIGWILPRMLSLLLSATKVRHNSPEGWHCTLRLKKQTYTRFREYINFNIMPKCTPGCTCTLASCEHIDVSQ